jgi:hypothetical protein
MVVGGLENSRSHVLNLVFIEDEGLGDAESPAHFEGSSDHGIGGGWGSRGQPVRVIEVNSSHVSRNIHQIDLGEEPGQVGLVSIVDVVLGSNILMHEPTCHFAIIDSINQVLSSDDVSSSKNVGFVFVLHSTATDGNLALVVLDQSFDGGLGVL